MIDLTTPPRQQKKPRLSLANRFRAFLHVDQLMLLGSIRNALNSSDLQRRKEAAELDSKVKALQRQVDEMSVHLTELNSHLRLLHP